MVIEHPGTTTGSATITGIMLFKDHTFRIKIQAEVNLLSNESQKLMQGLQEGMSPCCLTCLEGWQLTCTSGTCTVSASSYPSRDAKACIVTLKDFGFEGFA